MESIAASYPSSESESETESETERAATAIDQVKDLDKCDLPRLPNSVTEKYHLPPQPHHNMKNVGVGNKFWSTFIYLEWRPTYTERSLLTKMVMEFNETCRGTELPITQKLQFRPLHMSSLGSPLPLHISLSQNVTFQNEFHRDKLHEIISKKVQESKNCSPFHVKFDKHFKLMASNRTNALFLTLPLTSGIRKSEITDLVEIIRQSFAEIFPNSTEKELQNISIIPDSAHMSIGQSTNVSPTSIDYLSLLESHIPMDNDFEQLELSVSNIKFDKNRQVLSIPL